MRMFIFKLLVYISVNIYLYTYDANLLKLHIRYFKIIVYKAYDFEYS